MKKLIVIFFVLLFANISLVSAQDKNNLAKVPPDVLLDQNKEHESTRRTILVAAVAFGATVGIAGFIKRKKRERQQSVNSPQSPVVSQNI